MRNYLIGQVEDKLIFTKLPEVKDPIVKGLDKESEILACFLSEWNSESSAQSLLEYLYIIKNQDDSHDEFQDLLRGGINNEFDESSLLFSEEGIIVRSGRLQTKTIQLDRIIAIVSKWKLYLTVSKNKDVIAYGGKFYFSPKTVDEVETLYS